MLRPVKGSCPTCEKPGVMSRENRWRPFCSERCRLIDLGAWMEERYAIPTEQAPLLNKPMENGDTE